MLAVGRDRSIELLESVGESVRFRQLDSLLCGAGCLARALLGSASSNGRHGEKQGYCSDADESS
jgi:hypothetical protein